MKLNTETKGKLFVHLLGLVLVGLVMRIIPTAVSAQTSLDQAIAAHIEKVKEDQSEYQEARKIVYGDVNGDGTKDAVVQYTLEGAGGGNSWGQNLAVFLNKKGDYRLAGDETVGGKFFRSFTVQKVVGRKIVGLSETCPKDEPQGLCKNPRKKQVSYVLLGSKLKQR